MRGYIRRGDQMLLKFNLLIKGVIYTISNNSSSNWKFQVSLVIIGIEICIQWEGIKLWFLIEMKIVKNTRVRIQEFETITYISYQKIWIGQKFRNFVKKLSYLIAVISGGKNGY